MEKDILPVCESSHELLKKRSTYSLGGKIYLSKKRIREWYDYFNGKVYVAFSGGKDSTVLLHLVRSMFPDVPAVFSDTGLEYPEIKEFVRSTENVTIIRPKMSYRQVIEKYGYAVISKTVSMGLDRHRKTKSKVQRELRLHGGINPTSGKKQQRSIPIKYHYLVDAPFKVSEKCCYALKKQPFYSYENKTNRKPFIGIRAVDSNIRLQRYVSRGGCNAFTMKKESSWPLAFWNSEDIWDYLNKFNVPYSSIYSLGEEKTGCMWCMFGLQYDGNPNRFQRMKKTHPKIWNYCINKMGLKQVLDYIGSEYE